MYEARRQLIYVGCLSVRTYRRLAMPTDLHGWQPTFLCLYERTIQIQTYMRSKQNTDLYHYLEHTDIPMLLFIGFSLGWLIVGLLYITIGAFFEAVTNEIWSWKAICSGFISIGVSVIVGIIAALYWWLVPRKSGIIFPRMNGFGLILMVIAVFAGSMASIELILTIMNRL